MKTHLIIGLLVSSVLSSAVKAEFSGDFELAPVGCEATGKCTLTYKLLYKDPKGMEWEAAAKNVTDGASIPKWAQPFIGKPFDSSYIKAAVIHDHYCDRHVRSWRETHLAFYNAMKDLGVSPVKRKLMYFAVYLRGPKWVDLIEGKSCGTGVTCTNTVDDSVKTLLKRGDSYANKSFVGELEAVERELVERGGDISLEELENMAKKMSPDDFYYKNGSVVDRRINTSTM
jgi:hypothetical protein